ncbi:N-alpha-acetyltransferase 30 [Spea bombifrons]|uniref:N-alpha-acetyltransferase 30 n=1 Tax=Spea bombifrons TaxID=233779 RepID=UPI00234A332B|nr:N-alpha-acetyltransferase 30 [Spea bombifrons]XP_053331599.1 N-alpha-acetyltransferase 30 [Spea bombifrons]
MADAPPGPSVLSQYPGAGLALTTSCHPAEEQEDGEEEEEEESQSGKAGSETPARKDLKSADSLEGPKGHHRHHHHHHQLNGLIGPDLRHLKAVSLKNKYLGPEEPSRNEPGLPQPDKRTAAPNGLLDRGPETSEGVLSSCLASCTLRGEPDTNHVAEEDTTIRYVRYESELQMPDIMRLITKDLSEPYSIYTYRYFIHNWPQLCFLAMVDEECVGAIVCKLDMHKKMFRRGYIAMLAVDSKYRRKGIGTNLVKKAIYAMVEGDCDEVVLETEITNKSALKLYENLGFVRDKRLFRYYLNGVDALRLKLWLR